MKRVRLADVEIAVRDEGQGPIVVLVHGFPLNHSMWREQFSHLAGRYRLIAPDLTGFGQSGAIPGPLTMERLADDVAALLAALNVNEPVTFCGLSLGGYVAWQFWRRHADRLGRLILCDTRAQADSPEARDVRLRMAEHVAEHGLEYVCEAMLPKLFSPATKRDRPDLIAAAREMILATRPATIGAAQRGMAERPDVRDWLPRILVPALVVVGAEDEISRPEEMRSIAEALPQARLVIVPDAGHMAPLESPDFVNGQIERFLTESERSSDF